MDMFYDDDDLEVALFQMESAAFNFAYRYIDDSKMRQDYIDQTERLSLEYRLKVQRGEMTDKKAAEHAMHIKTVEVQRMRSSSVGRTEPVKTESVEIPPTTSGRTYQQIIDSLPNQKEAAPTLVSTHYEDTEGNKISKVLIGEIVYLSISSKNAAGKTMEIDLSDNTKDFEYQGKVLENDRLEIPVNGDIQKIKLKVIAQHH